MWKSAWACQQDAGSKLAFSRNQTWPLRRLHLGICHTAPDSCPRTSLDLQIAGVHLNYHAQIESTKDRYVQFARAPNDQKGRPAPQLPRSDKPLLAPTP